MITFQNTITNFDQRISISYFNKFLKKWEPFIEPLYLVINMSLETIETNKLKKSQNLQTGVMITIPNNEYLNINISDDLVIIFFLDIY